MNTLNIVTLMVSEWNFAPKPVPSSGTEPPFDGSWGYQNTGFYAPTSRYTTAAQLIKMIDKLHNAGIGAIMDFVPVLFAVDTYGLKEYHFDGLRMDAVSRLIHWQGDEKRGENETAINFLKVMNKGLHNLPPTAMLIAEDSTAYHGVTKNVDDGGLDFDYKWDWGWMHDTLKYFECHPYDRAYMPDKITFIRWFQVGRLQKR